MWARWRFGLLIIIDVILLNIGLLLSFYLRFFDEGGIPDQFYKNLDEFCILGTVIYIISFFIFRLYNRIWSYASTDELLAIINAVSLGALCIVTASFLFRIPLPRSIIILSWSFTIILIGGSRFAWRLYIDKKNDYGVNHSRKALIVGAGAAGAMVAKELVKNSQINLRPICFVDDDPIKKNKSIMGLPILGNREDIPNIVNYSSIDEIIIAMPSANGHAVRDIVNICQTTSAEIKVLPGVYEIIDGRVSVEKLRPLQLEDLLHRESVNVDLDGIADYLRGMVVLVTGAGGSIGSELCRQICLFEPSRLVILGHGENSIHRIWRELTDSFPNQELSVEIVDVRDFSRVNHVFDKYSPSVIFHAAAHKHVPLMEMHPVEAIKTNVFGTRNVARAAHRAGAKTFIFISTDKAVNPSSVMGASKLLAELIIRQLNNESTTVYAAVRFGNVLGSNGSVVQIFREQIRRGGPVTVTHLEMTRYFMTIPEAVSLVIQAGSMAKGGEVFVLDMGEPVKIVDLAYDMIRLSGYEPEKDIEIVYTGTRPGEKLYEELLTSEEGTTATFHKKIFVARPCLVDASGLKKELICMEKLTSEADGEIVFHVLKRVIPGFIDYRKVYDRNELNDNAFLGIIPEDNKHKVNSH